MKITKDTFVRLRYCMEIEGEKTPEWFSKPIEVSFVFGREAIPTIIERAIENKEENEKVVVTIPPQSAYGPHLNYLVKELELSSLKYPEKVIPGEWYEEVSPYGSRTFFKVLEIRGDKVVADFNHPAAGKNVLMKIEILEVRPATSYEIMSAELRACGGG
ncbi:MAG: peptidylprolyl isomerase [Caldimicrobium sp.]